MDRLDRFRQKSVEAIRERTILVDSCRSCPFYGKRWKDDPDSHYRGICLGLRDGSRSYSLGPWHSHIGNPPPNWCPLRKKPTTVQLWNEALPYEP